jgi:hypothetical protein
VREVAPGRSVWLWAYADVIVRHRDIGRDNDLVGTTSMFERGNVEDQQRYHSLEIVLGRANVDIQIQLDV